MTKRLWFGQRTPRREFPHSDDLADALRFLLENYDLPGIINVGGGGDITVRKLAEIVMEVVGFKANLFLMQPSQMVRLVSCWI
jgi:GDP-L-fucose synthase